MPETSPHTDPQAAPCVYCNFAQHYPEHIVTANDQWVLAHIHDHLPIGTLVLIPQHHGLIHEITAAAWKEAAPLIEFAANSIVAVCSAHRVYSLSFSELDYHFHLAFVPKTVELQQAHGDKVAIQLLADWFGTTPFDPDAAVATARAYRDYLAAHPIS